jgi:hypothetical protein
MSETSKIQRQFDILYATLCEVQTGLVNSTAQVAGFLLLSTGWIATSDTAQKLLRSDRFTRRLAVAALGGAFVLYVAATMKTFVISEKTFALLKKLDFMPPDYYENRRVDSAVLVVFLVGNLFLAGLEAGLVLRA